jgi:AAA domain
MSDARETAFADYLAALPEDERRAAVARTNAAVKLKAPVDSVDPPPPIRNLEEYLETEFPTPPALISRHQLVRGEITCMVARAGKGKTTLMQNRAVRWSAGLPLFDEDPESQAPVGPLRILIVENEGVAWHMQEKLSLLLNKTGGLNFEQKELAKENLLIWGDGGYSGLKVDRDKDYELLRRGCEEHKPDVLVLEPFRKLWAGEENNSTEMEAVLDDISALAHEFEVGVMLSHHARKSPSEDGDLMTEARGSGDLEGAVAVMEHYTAVKGKSLRELSWSKSRYDPPAAPMRLAWNPETWRVELVAEDAISGAILRLMQESPSSLFRVAELAEQLEESQSKIREGLDRLLDSERIVKKKASERGERGYVYRLKTGDDEGEGGLSIA